MQRRKTNDSRTKYLTVINIGLKETQLLTIPPMKYLNKIYNFCFIFILSSTFTNMLKLE